MRIHSFLSHCGERQSDQNHLTGTGKNQDQLTPTILRSTSDQRYRNDLGQAAGGPNHAPNESSYGDKIVFCKTGDSHARDTNGCEDAKAGGVER